MNTNRIFPLLAAVVIVLSMLACNFGSSPTQPSDSTTNVSTPITAGETNEAPTASPTEAANACDNPYLPIVVGATWNYKLTGPVPDTFTHSIVSVENDSFVEQDVFGSAGVTRQGKWNCDHGNLVALNPPSGSSGTVSAEGVSVDLETKELSGVTLPAAIHAGDTWSQSLMLEGTETINETVYPTSNQVTSDCKAIGMESVTVEAGTFDAMRIECHTTMKIAIAMGNSPVETTLDMTGTNWYVENVGVVKTLATGMGIDSATELVSYNIP